MPKIITTPEQGPLAGTVQVWDATDFVPYHSHTFDEGSDMSGHMGHGGSSMLDSGVDSMMPGMGDSEAATSPIVEFQPFNGEGGAVELTTSYLRQDGAPVLPVILNWQSDSKVAYTSISENGTASTTVLHYGEAGNDPAFPAVQRPTLQRAVGFRLDVGPMGPSPIVLDLSQMTGPVAAAMAGERFLIASAFGGTVEKWDGQQWVDVVRPPSGGSPADLLRQLNFRLIGSDDLIRWTPPAYAEAATSVFRIIGWDGENIADDGHEETFTIEEVITVGV